MAVSNHPIASLITRLRQWQRHEKGVAAVEFALILPFMVVLLFGSIEVTQAISASRKLIMSTRTAGDLSSQVTTLDDTDYASIYSAVAAVYAPFDPTKGTMVVSGITVSTTGIATVSWSASAYRNPRACSSTVTLPANLMPTLGTTAFIVWAEGTFNYTPTLGYVISGSLALTEQLFMRPRVGSVVTYSGSTACQKVL
jgi:Flp pilus assembly protein TadG